MRDGLEMKAKAFAAHLSKIFEPYSREITRNEEKKLLTNTNIPAKMVAPAKPFTVKEVRTFIRVLNYINYNYIILRRHQAMT